MSKVSSVILCICVDSIGWIKNKGYVVNFCTLLQSQLIVSQIIAIEQQVVLIRVNHYMKTKSQGTFPG